MPKQIETRDSVIPYLVIVSYPSSGNCSYYMRASTGNRKRIKLGTSGELTLDQARVCAVKNNVPSLTVVDRTVDEVFNEFVSIGQLNAKRSIEREQKRYSKSVQPIIGSMPIKVIALTHVRRVMDGLAPALSIATRNRYLAMLRAMFRFAVTQGYCDQDPTRGLKLVREIQHKTYEVTDDLGGRLSEAVIWLDGHYPRVGALVTFLLSTGMRIGEALAIKWEDVDHSLEHITLSTTKGGKKRHVPINAACKKVLGQLAESTPAFVADSWLFPGVLPGKPMSRPVRPWKKACLVVGLPAALRFHDLRHIYASFCVKDGIPLYTVQRLLGHSSIRMTERYASLAHCDLQIASERVAKAMAANFVERM